MAPAGYERFALWFEMATVLRWLTKLLIKIEDFFYYIFLFVLVNVYAPTEGNPEKQKCFLSFVREHLYNFLSKKSIIRGDLNTYMNHA